MITYGISMQDKEQKVPEEVVAWLLERNELYPQIEFRIHYIDHPGDEFSSFAEKYSKSWSVMNPQAGIDAVGFFYRHEVWSIRIVGASDGNGNIIDMGTGASERLGPELRAKISGIPPAEVLEGIGDKSYGLPRPPDEPVQDRATNLVNLSPTE